MAVTKTKDPRYVAATAVGEMRSRLDNALKIFAPYVSKNLATGFDEVRKVRELVDTLDAAVVALLDEQA